MEIVYIGPSTEGVRIVELDGLHAEQLVALDVPDDVAERLLEQDVWATPAELATPASKNRRRRPNGGLIPAESTDAPAGDEKEPDHA